MASFAAREVAEETPIAFRYAEIPYAVMMATPADLGDFAAGFSLSEGIAAEASDIRGIRSAADGDGIRLDITLAPEALRRFLGRHRTRALHGHTSCGLCGVEDLASVPVVTGRVAPLAVTPAAIRRAVDDLRRFQPLSAATRAAHAAAWVSLDGRVAFAREDVGRHNALDKLVGACLADPVDRDAGFCLITSRCSFEMVQKAAAAGFRALVALSAPTARAIRAAREAGVALTVHAASDAPVCYNE